MHIVFPYTSVYFHASGQDLSIRCLYFIFNYFRSCARRSCTCAIIWRYSPASHALRQSFASGARLTNSLLNMPSERASSFSTSPLPWSDARSPCPDPPALQTAYRWLPLQSQPMQSKPGFRLLVLLKDNLARIAKSCEEYTAVLEDGQNFRILRIQRILLPSCSAVRSWMRIARRIAQVRTAS